MALIAARYNPPHMRAGSEHGDRIHDAAVNPPPGLPVTKHQNNELLWNMRQLDI